MTCHDAFGDNWTSFRELEWKTLNFYGRGSGKLQTHLTRCLLVRAYAWILLKYRPECWWFELPLLAYKVSSLS